MAFEFYQAMVGAPAMSLYSWKQLAQWSIDYSCMKESDIIAARKELDKRWQAFCEDIVKTYGPLVVLDKFGDTINGAQIENFYEATAERLNSLQFRK
jgi:adenosine deaminase CECR1